MHPAFKDKSITVRNFILSPKEAVECAVDYDGHGSHCAGIATGAEYTWPVDEKDKPPTYYKIPSGVAPGAKLIICKVSRIYSKNYGGKTVLAALKWLKEIITSKQETIDVVSLSFGMPHFSHELSSAISDLVDNGVIVVCAASNSGRTTRHPINYPARLGHVLCIGSHDNCGKPTSFSPVGRQLDFLAPGEGIWGPFAGTYGPFSTDSKSGTSCSTPAVAGLVCLILHDIRRRCETEDSANITIAGKPITDHVKNVWVMRELLKKMSSSPGHHSEELGCGTLDPYLLLDSNTTEIFRIVKMIIGSE